MGKALTVQEKVANVGDMIKKNQKTLMSVIPKHVDPDRLMKVCFNAVRINPNLLDADPKSLMAALINSATLGLEPNTPLGLAYLIPFKKEVTLIVGYKGLVALAKRAKAIIDVNPHVVYENEVFEYEEGDRPILRHTPLPPSERGKKRIGVYSRVVLPGGVIPTPAFMWAEEVEAIKKKAPGASSSKSPWNGTEYDQDEMWKKTAIRRHFKLMDLDPTVNRAIALDEQYEHGMSPRDFTLDGEFIVTDKPDIEPVKEIGEGEAPEKEKAAPESPATGKAEGSKGKGGGKQEKAGKADEKAEKPETSTQEEEGPPDSVIDAQADAGTTDKKDKDPGSKTEKPDADKSNKEPDPMDKVKANIRELCDALGNDDADIKIMDCKDDDDLKNLRTKLLKEYNGKFNE